MADVIAEAVALVDSGARELILLGQNVNAYHGVSPAGGEWRLAELIKELAEIPNLERLRYTTSHPRDMTSDLIRAHGEIEILMPYLHLPVQSGSDRVLSAMNRQHTSENYLDIIEAVRAARPNIALSSDFIVGHPGETEEDFEDTLTLVERVGFAQAYSFKYSPRPGTPASAMEDIVTEDEKSSRLARLQEVLNKQQSQFNEEFVGVVLPVLLDRKGRDENQLAGRSPWMQAVHVDFDGPELAQLAYGKTIDVRITTARPNSLAALPLNKLGSAG